jgi:hypothetical protein
LSDFVLALAQDFKDNEDSWENQNLLTFLEAISTWIKDMDGFYVNQGKEIPHDVPWGTQGLFSYTVLWTSRLGDAPVEVLNAVKPSVFNSSGWVSFLNPAYSLLTVGDSGGFAQNRTAESISLIFEDYPKTIQMSEPEFS